MSNIPLPSFSVSDAQEHCRSIFNNIELLDLLIQI